jgi:KipI family sensor histidine kinase inhibitor
VIRPFGEAALLLDGEPQHRILALAASLRADPLPGTAEAVPGLGSLLVEVDAVVHDPTSVAAALERRLAGLPAEPVAGRLHRIPVVYGGTSGPDLPEVARLLGMSETDVVSAHAAVELRVLFCGFAAGFAYLGDLPDGLRVPRLATPRTHTPPGSVAIAGPMTGIYPANLPGGWRVIGRTPLRMFDPGRVPPARLEPGDMVRFEAVAADAATDPMAGWP